MRYWFFTIHMTAKREAVSDEFAASILSKHTNYFLELEKTGHCTFAGPFVDRTTEMGGGFYGLVCETEKEARELAAKDPLVLEGLYDYRIKEWKKVVPA